MEVGVVDGNFFEGSKRISGSQLEVGGGTGWLKLIILVEGMEIMLGQGWVGWMCWFV